MTTVLRSLLERASRRIVLKRRFPSRFGGGAIYVSPDAALRFFRLDLEATDPNLFANVEELVHPGDIVWDIGANVGLFAFGAAARAGHAGRVLAVEADTWLVDLLRRSGREQPATSAPVDVLPVAISSEVGVAQFHIAGRGRASNHLHGAGLSQAGGTREVQHVVTLSLDWLLGHWPAPKLLKIDVEGAEVPALSGAKRIFEEARPTLLCEVGGEAADEVGAILKSHRYVLFDADVPRNARRPLDRPPWNTLAFPEERAGRS